MLPVKIDLNKAEIKKFYVSGREMGRGKSGTCILQNVRTEVNGY